MVINVLEEMSKELSEICSFGKMIPFRLARTFANNTINIQNAELVLYQAFSAPLDDIFYLSEDHPDLEMLRNNTFIHEI